MILKAARTLFTIGAIGSMIKDQWLLAACLTICAFVLAALEDE